MCVFVVLYRPSMQQMSKVHIAYGSKKMADEKKENEMALHRVEWVTWMHGVKLTDYLSCVEL